MNLSKKSKTTCLTVAAGLSVLMLSACNGSNNDNDNAIQVDRMGRAGVNTAVTDPFFDDTDATQNTSHGNITDMYNSVTSQSDSVAMFSDRFEGNLAIYDGLDMDCDNQLARDANDDPYSFLAGVLANDQVFVNSTSGTCNQYFGVELAALGAPTGDDCGGRTPLYDTIDVTYSALAIGATSGVGDGVDIDADANGGHSTDTFPFLAPPIANPTTQP